MLSESEKQLCSELLKLLDVSTLYSLKDTITRHVIVAKTKKEAIDVILDCSLSMSELLSRKKLKKDIVLKYLIQKGIPTSPTSSKEALIQSILDYSKNVNVAETSVSCSVSSLPIASFPSPLGSIQELSSNFYCQQMACSVANENQQMSKEFVSWFYPMLNFLSGIPMQNPYPWSDKHFWPDCVLECHLHDGNITLSDQHKGAVAVGDRLRSLIEDYKFIFNANDYSSGHQGQINEHGLAEIQVSGTVHQLKSDQKVQQLCGIFNQMFGLMRDPNEENRWKIKYTKLFVKSNE